MSERELYELMSSNLKKYMQLRNISQLELAESLGVSQQSVSNWCTGLKMPRMNKIDRICELLEISREELMRAEPAFTGARAALSASEERLIRNYRILDSEDRQQVEMIVETFVSKDKYRKDTSERKA